MFETVFVSERIVENRFGLVTNLSPSLMFLAI